MENLQSLAFTDVLLENGSIQPKIILSYEVFGQPIGSVPVVLVNHALTGNSTITGENGWWQDIIGNEKTINTNDFTIIAFNIPGNGYDNVYENLIPNYTDFTAKDIANIFWKGLSELNINSLFALIGGSLGGGIAWEMAALEPNKIENLIPIATDWKATDWVIANVHVQDQILNNSDNPIADARAHAMLLYRTPQSLHLKFNRSLDKTQSNFRIENWLVNHGVKLQNRFRLQSYKLMNHLLKTVDITKNGRGFLEVASAINANIHIIAVDTDYFYIPEENRESVNILSTIKPNVFYHEIQSIHGHDAFLIESNQLSKILEPIFASQKVHATIRE